jgi:protein phosphatase
MEYSANSDTGNVRDQNEDYYYASDNLFIVADGMGGHKAGEIASRTVIEKFVDFFIKNNQAEVSSDKNTQNEKIRTLLTSSISFANNEVLKLAKSNPQYNGMGTTFTGCYVLLNGRTAEVHVIHAGDSRLYLKRAKSFELITQDHTLVGKMYRDGIITYEESFTHPLKNYLENVVGLESAFKSDYIKLNLHAKDILILCSDGLNSMIKDKEIDRIAAKYKQPQKITEALIEKAKANGGHDNITVITIKF